LYLHKEEKTQHGEKGFGKMHKPEIPLSCDIGGRK